MRYIPIISDMEEQHTTIYVINYGRNFAYGASGSAKMAKHYINVKQYSENVNKLSPEQQRKMTRIVNQADYIFV